MPSARDAVPRRLKLTVTFFASEIARSNVFP